MVPVFIEIDSNPVVRYPVVGYLEIFTGGVTFDELRLSVGSKWIPGGRFFVADSLHAVDEEPIVSLRPGMLIRLLPRTRPATGAPLLRLSLRIQRDGLNMPPSLGHMRRVVRSRVSV